MRVGRSVFFGVIEPDSVEATSEYVRVRANSLISLEDGVPVSEIVSGSVSPDYPAVRIHGYYLEKGDAVYPQSNEIEFGFEEFDIKSVLVKSTNAPHVSRSYREKFWAVLGYNQFARAFQWTYGRYYRPTFGSSDQKIIDTGGFQEDLFGDTAYVPTDSFDLFYPVEDRGNSIKSPGRFYASITGEKEYFDPLPVEAGRFSSASNSFLDEKPFACQKGLETQFYTKSVSASDSSKLFIDHTTSWDYIYVASRKPFGGVELLIPYSSQNAVGLTIEYSNGGSWEPLELLEDTTETLKHSGVITWKIPLDWESDIHLIDRSDNYLDDDIGISSWASPPLYFVRFSASAPAGVTVEVDRILPVNVVHDGEGGLIYFSFDPELAVPDKKSVKVAVRSSGGAYTPDPGMFATAASRKLLAGVFSSAQCEADDIALSLDRNEAGIVGYLPSKEYGEVFALTASGDKLYFGVGSELWVADRLSGTSRLVELPTSDRFPSGYLAPYVIYPIVCLGTFGEWVYGICTASKPDELKPESGGFANAFAFAYNTSSAGLSVTSLLNFATTGKFLKRTGWSPGSDLTYIGQVSATRKASENIPIPFDQKISMLYYATAGLGAGENGHSVRPRAGLWSTAAPGGVAAVWYNYESASEEGLRGPVAKLSKGFYCVWDEDDNTGGEYDLGFSSEFGNRGIVLWTRHNDVPRFIYQVQEFDYNGIRLEAFNPLTWTSEDLYLNFFFGKHHYAVSGDVVDNLLYLSHIVTKDNRADSSIPLKAIISCAALDRTERVKAWDKVWFWNDSASSWIDITSEINAGTSNRLIESGDYVYLGFDHNLVFRVRVSADSDYFANLKLEVRRQYWNGSEWVEGWQEPSEIRYESSAGIWEAVWSPDYNDPQSYYALGDPPDGTNQRKWVRLKFDAPGCDMMLHGVRATWVGLWYSWDAPLQTYLTPMNITVIGSTVYGGVFDRDNLSFGAFALASYTHLDVSTVDSEGEDISALVPTAFGGLDGSIVGIFSSKKFRNAKVIEYSGDLTPSRTIDLGAQVDFQTGLVHFNDCLFAFGSKNEVVSYGPKFEPILPLDLEGSVRSKLDEILGLVNFTQTVSDEGKVVLRSRNVPGGTYFLRHGSVKFSTDEAVDFVRVESEEGAVRFGKVSQEGSQVTISSSLLKSASSAKAVARLAAKKLLSRGRRAVVTTRPLIHLDILDRVFLRLDRDEVDDLASRSYIIEGIKLDIHSGAMTLELSEE